MQYSVRLSASVKQELFQIADWYRQRAGAEEVGDEWYVGFIAALERLAENPQICSLARESDMMSIELRELHYGSGKQTTHRAIFEIVGDEVRVHAIRHVAQQDLSKGEIESNW